jgi:hypothetical protein
VLRLAILGVGRDEEQPGKPSPGTQPCHPLEGARLSRGNPAGRLSTRLDVSIWIRNIGKGHTLEVSVSPMRTRPLSRPTLCLLMSHFRQWWSVSIPSPDRFWTGTRCNTAPGSWSSWPRRDCQPSPTVFFCCRKPRMSIRWSLPFRQSRAPIPGIRTRSSTPRCIRTSPQRPDDRSWRRYGRTRRSPPLCQPLHPCPRHLLPHGHPAAVPAAVAPDARHTMSSAQGNVFPSSLVTDGGRQGRRREIASGWTLDLFPREGGNLHILQWLCGLPTPSVPPRL